MARMGVVGIVIEGDRSHANKVQSILHEYGEIIVGRMGIPDKQRGVNVISLIVDGTNQQIESLKNKLSEIKSVTVSVAMTAVEV